MMGVLEILSLHHTWDSRTLGCWPRLPHWPLGMCGWGMHLLCIGEVFALPLTPISPVFLVSFRLVPRALTTTTLAPLLFPLGPTKNPQPPHVSQGPNATCGGVVCEVLVHVSDARTVFCVTRGNVPFCADHSMEFKGQSAY